MPGLLDGKVAIVTGAAHGIGRGHALELAKQGAAVVVNDLGTTISGDGSGRDADVVVDIIRSRGGRAIADYGDVGDEDQVEALVDRAWTEYGRVDILVNNAGIVRDRAIWNMPVADFDLVMRVHVRGTWLACRSVARRWRTNAKASTGTTYGRIINTVSGAGLLGHFGQSNYATAKSAIAGLTLTLSLELASIGVTVNAIGPGGLTRLSASGKDDVVPEPDERPEDSFDPLDASLCSPVVAWLASEQASQISGQVIRAIGDKIYLMGGWTEDAVACSNEQRWDATRLGEVFGTEIFGTRARGLRLGG
ncbi:MULTISPECIES: SDR family NAD(P)-dependent oxidoreductase [Streptomyces]|uniref:SDR family NAD(P)-dependent oxidoreductase n=1 Tax=Streptomyces TaxID=1883 RepID=UPI002259BDF0|nr:MULTISPECIES: SDR family NAD(P)-dependent oxidoreductase [Streptomyces]MCX5059146.1 SDR family NAD(P)-dependent oxidoreductase [Streptomyces sp. NBC_00452]WSD90537.1 SDR family NAD(P)-dependent oxidoreductase [Streptomyces canus]